MTTSNHADHESEMNLQDKFQLLVESAEEYAIFLMDVSGYIQSWNRGAQHTQGYTDKDIIGQHFSVFYTPGDVTSGKPDKDLLRASREGHIEIEDWRVRKDGGRYWASTVIAALYTDDDILVGFSEITRDITDKKRSKDALMVANKMLKHQHVELEALNNVKDEFVSLASHQLRTPATGIKQFLGILLEGYAGQLTSQQSEYIKKAYDSNERQIELVNSLLRTAQLDAGRISLSKSFTSLHSLIEDVIDGMRDVLSGREQTVQIVDDTHVADIYVDQLRMRMVFENLIDNASKYTEVRGAITITLTETKTHVTISIKDTGVGIPVAEQKQIFDKFSRVPNKLSDLAGGTGLGLYWVKKIVSLHKGTVKIESEVDRGTEFIIKIPKGVVRV